VSQPLTPDPTPPTGGAPPYEPHSRTIAVVGAALAVAVLVAMVVAAVLASLD
jgi:hypothetical protein